MIERAEECIVAQDLKVKVARPEDIIGLKIGAIVNDARLEGKYLADIEEIITHFDEKLDWREIETGARICQGEHLYEKIKRSH